MPFFTLQCVNIVIHYNAMKKYKLNEFNDLDYPAKPRWPLDEKAAFLKGAGVQL